MTQILAGLKGSMNAGSGAGGLGLPVVNPIAPPPVVKRLSYRQIGCLMEGARFSTPAVGHSRKPGAPHLALGMREPWLRPFASLIRLKGTFLECRLAPAPTALTFHPRKDLHPE